MSNLTDKKSFILYKDSLNILPKMTNEQAGIFIKIIYNYQLTGALPELDFAMEMAINPFINQFARDNDDWLDKKNKASQAGKASANARQQKQRMSTDVENVQQDPTDSTVKVTANVSVNANANVMDKVTKKDTLQNNASSDAMLLVKYFNEVNKTTSIGAKPVIEGLNKILKDYSIDDVKSVINFMSDSWYSQNQQNTLSVLAKYTKFYEKLEKAQQVVSSKKQSPDDDSFSEASRRKFAHLMGDNQ